MSSGFFRKYFSEISHVILALIFIVLGMIVTVYFYSSDGNDTNIQSWNISPKNSFISNRTDSINEIFQTNYKEEIQSKRIEKKNNINKAVKIDGQLVLVPSVLNLSLKNAQIILMESELLVGSITSIPAETKNIGMVINQTPLMGEKIKHQGEVNLFVGVEIIKEKSVESDVYFVAVEEMPEPIGGIDEIQKNIVYPEIAKRAGVEGKVYVLVFVNESGTVTDAKIIKGIGAGCDEAALDAVKKTKFKPGRQRGKTVKVQVSIPVVFRLSSSILELND